MAPLELWVGGDTLPGVGHYSATTAALNARIITFTTLKDMVEDATLKGAFESVLAILTLVGVFFFAQFLCNHSSMTGPGRADGGRLVYRTGRTLFQNLPRIGKDYG